MTVEDQIIHLKPQKQSYAQGQLERHQQEILENQALGGIQNQSVRGHEQQSFEQGSFDHQSRGPEQQREQSFQGQGYKQGMQNQVYGQDQGMQSYGQGQNVQSQGGMTGMATGTEMGTQHGHHNQSNSLNRFGGRGKHEQRIICIPCDLTTESMHIVEWVNNNVLQSSDRVILVAVRNKTTPTMTQTLPTNLVDVNEVHALKEDEKSAEILLKFCDLMPGIDAETKVLRGDYRSEIVRYVNALQPNICVVAEEHMAGLKKVFKGSTSEYLVHNLKVPVLVLPSRQ